MAKKSKTPAADPSVEAREFLERVKTWLASGMTINLHIPQFTASVAQEVIGRLVVLLHIQHLAGEVAKLKFRNPGKRKRNKIIVRLRAAGMTQGEIGKSAEVRAANGGLPMSGKQVADVLRRAKAKRKAT